MESSQQKQEQKKLTKEIKYPLLQETWELQEMASFCLGLPPLSWKTPYNGRNLPYAVCGQRPISQIRLCAYNIYNWSYIYRPFVDKIFYHFIYLYFLFESSSQVLTFLTLFFLLFPCCFFFVPFFVSLFCFVNLFYCFLSFICTF